MHGLWRAVAIALGSGGLLVWGSTTACSSSAAGPPAGSATGSSAGGSSSATGGAGSGAGGGQGGACANLDSCAKACCKLVAECGFPVTCSELRPIGLVDCDTDPGRCHADAFNEASCEALTSLLSPSPDSFLITELVKCGVSGTCGPCVLVSCESLLLHDCFSEPLCIDLLRCMLQDGCTSATCVQQCQTDFVSLAGQSLLACLCGNCSEGCPRFCPAGAGGASAGGGGGTSAGGAGGGR